MIFDLRQRHPMEERPFSTNEVLEKLDITGENKNLDLSLLPYKKQLNGSWFQCKTIKPLEKNKRKSLGPRARQRILRLGPTKQNPGKKQQIEH